MGRRKAFLPDEAVREGRVVMQPGNQRAVGDVGRSEARVGGQSTETLTSRTSEWTCVSQGVTLPAASSSTGLCPSRCPANMPCAHRSMTSALLNAARVRSPVTCGCACCVCICSFRGCQVQGARASAQPQNTAAPQTTLQPTCVPVISLPLSSPLPTLLLKWMHSPSRCPPTPCN